MDGMATVPHGAVEGFELEARFESVSTERKGNTST